MAISSGWTISSPTCKRRRSSNRCGTACGYRRVVTVIVVPAAFVFAYALTRSCMPFKGLFRTITLTPLLAPSLLSAISSSTGSATRACSRV